MTLKSVVKTTTHFAETPDNQGRDNPASAHLMAVIATGRADAHTFFGTVCGQVILGESGTEILFRLIRTACVNAGTGAVIGSTVEPRPPAPQRFDGRMSRGLTTSGWPMTPNAGW
ncbi:MAG: hypothetical protein GDA53_05735 [Rhodobacteraceae bacterium]|nr:hypothetical protein [Paracoccaceae bacterium]